MNTISRRLPHRLVSLIARNAIARGGRFVSSAPLTPYPTDICITDNDSAWEQVGFNINAADKYADFGEIRLWFKPGSGGKGITSWGFANLDVAASNCNTSTLCGIPMINQSNMDKIIDDTSYGHPNGVVGIDHIVISTKNPQWVENEFLRLGIKKKRETTNNKLGISYSFYRPGKTILEVISTVADINNEIVPSVIETTEMALPGTYIWGITFVTKDIDFTHKALVDLTKLPWDAVQKGRKITTLNSQKANISTKVAFISQHQEVVVQPDMELP